MTAARPVIRGAGGGGGKGGGSQHAATEESDSLKSVQYAEVLDLISEGEIVGLVNGLKSVYLDQVPVMNGDGSLNFEGVSFAATVGTQAQAALPGFPAAQAEASVSTEVLKATPIVRTITDANVDTVRVTVSVPQLSTQNTSNGDIGGAEVEFAIDIQSDGGGFVEVHRATIKGKTMSRYQRAVRLALPGAAPWDVRVRRISDDAATSNIQNKLFWESYTEIQSLRLRYPNCAVHGLRVSSRRFTRVPVRAYDVLGIICRVPSNFNAYSGEYSGVWDGTFSLSWTSNPAWILYELVTNTRYGLGSFVDEALVDKWRLYEIGRYCDEKVPNGYGLMEPRFTCNLVLQSRAEAYKVLQDIAAIFRGIVFASAASIQFAQDAPADAEMIFTPANVRDGLFNYSSSSAKAARHSVCIVYWNDPREFFKVVPEVVIIEELVAKYGLREMTLRPLGCKSRGQANRLGRWALYSEQNEAELVSFTTGLEGGGASLRSVIRIHDPSETGERLGGRVREATASLVTLDRAVTLEAATDYTLMVQRPDSHSQTGYVIEERAVTSAAGTRNALAVSPAFSSAPQPQDMWVLASSTVVPSTWRVLSIKPNGKEFDITAVAHHPGKFALIEQGVQLEPRPVSRLNIRAVQPLSIAFHEVLYVDRSTYKTRLSISWEPNATIGGRNQRYRLTWRFETGVWHTLPDTADTSIDISGLDPGLFEVLVVAINALGNEAPALGASYNILGKLAPPTDMTNLRLFIVANGVQAWWDEPPDPDWQSSELSRSPVFEPAQQITLKRSTTHLLGWLPAGVNTVYGRHWDEARPSTNATAAAITILAPLAPVLLRAEAQDNDVVLRWTDCASSQPIKRFIYRVGVPGDVWADGTDYGGAGGDQRSDILTFNSAGLKRVFIAAEDLAGNVGPAAYVDLNVVLPQNFVLTDSVDSSFGGTKTHSVSVGDGTLYMLVVDETWADHFANNGYAHSDDQVADDNPLFFQPGVTTASYSEEVDLARVVGSSTVNVIAQYAWLAGDGTITPTISYKQSAGDPWFDVVGDWAVVATNFRYIRIRLDVAGSGGDDLLQLVALHLRVAVRELTEYAQHTTVATDASGTPYVTTKGFVDLKAATWSTSDDAVWKHSVILDDSVLPPVVRVKAWNGGGTRITASGSLIIGGA